MYYLSIACIAKDEHPNDLLEFCAYHKALGVDHVYVYDNESRIPIARSLNQYLKERFVSVIPWVGKSPQMPAYANALYRFGKETKWLAYIDADEFLVPRAKNTIPEILSDYEKSPIGGLNVSWLIFGSNGYDRRPTGLVIENYTKCMAELHPESMHTKAIVLPERTFSSGTNPHYMRYKIGFHSVSEDFRSVEGALTRHSSERIVLNHYCLKSKEDFERKIAKPRADKFELGGKTMDDFTRFDKDCLIEDKTIERFIPLVKQELDRIATITKEQER